MKLISAALYLCLVFLGSAIGFEKSADPVQLNTQKGTFPIFVELALTDKEWALGLMHREHMNSQNGMLFDYGEERAVNFWMKNTLIPLDIIFIKPNGEVNHMHENAKPHDETPISSQGPIHYVLEINAGLVERMGLRVGDIITHPRFSQ